MALGFSLSLTIAGTTAWGEGLCIIEGSEELSLSCGAFLPQGPPVSPDVDIVCSSGQLPLLPFSKPSVMGRGAPLPSPQHTDKDIGRVTQLYRGHKAHLGWTVPTVHMRACH